MTEIVFLKVWNMVLSLILGICVGNWLLNRKNRK